MESSDEESSNHRTISYNKSQWLKKLQEVELFESDVHFLIMNYFIVCGHKDAVLQFAKETNTECEIPIHSLEARNMIKQSILKGEMEKATSLLNSINPQILETNPQINFSLKKNQLLQFIEKGETMKGLEFAQQSLAPCVREHQYLLPHLEEVMTQLALPSIKLKDEKGVVTSSSEEEKEATAQEIDDAILCYYNIKKEPLLESLVKHLTSTQDEMKKESIKFWFLENFTNGYLTKTVAQPNTQKKHTSESSNHRRELHTSGTISDSITTSLLPTTPVIRARHSRLHGS